MKGKVPTNMAPKYVDKHMSTGTCADSVRETEKRDGGDRCK